MTPEPSFALRHAAVIVALVGGLGALAAAAATSWVAWRAADRAFDAKMVEIGISILASDPGRSDISPARRWAIELVGEHSGKPFDNDDQKLLLHRPLGRCVSGTNGFSDGSTFSDRSCFGATP